MSSKRKCKTTARFSNQILFIINENYLSKVIINKYNFKFSYISIFDWRAPFRFLCVPYSGQGQIFQTNKD